MTVDAVEPYQLIHLPLMSVEATAIVSKHLTASMLGLHCCLVSTQHKQNDVTLALQVTVRKLHQDYNLNCMSNGLNDAIKNTCPFYFK